MPVGAVSSSWGGTNIENWMSAEAMSACTMHTDPGPSECSTPTALYNGMLNPFIRMTIAGFLWWQGESNAHTVANAMEYSCNQKAFVADLRSKYSQPNLPYIFVQSFPLFGNLQQFQPYPSSSSNVLHTIQSSSSSSISSGDGKDGKNGNYAGMIYHQNVPPPPPPLQGLSALRLAQADALKIPYVGMACTIDMGDVGSPFTWQHNRAKKQCAHRAVLAARAIIYGEEAADVGTTVTAGTASALVYRGPEPTSVEILPSESPNGNPAFYVELLIHFNMHASKGIYRHPNNVPISVLSFEVLAVDEGMPANSSSFWIPATLLPPAQANASTVAVGAAIWFSPNAVIKAVRYAHGDFPTGILHNVEGLPIAPFIINVTQPPLPNQYNGSTVDVFYAGLQPKVHAAGMESCYRIPSLLYIPPADNNPTSASASAAASAEAKSNRGNKTTTYEYGTLLAVAEAKHGQVCGDGVNTTLVMRRSMDGGNSWGAAFFPYKSWEPNRKWVRRLLTARLPHPPKKTKKQRKKKKNGCAESNQ